MDIILDEDKMACYIFDHVPDLETSIPQNIKMSFLFFI